MNSRLINRNEYQSFMSKKYFIKPLRTSVFAALALMIGLLGATDVAKATGSQGKFAAGTNFSLAVKSDGTVWASGYNALGQLGDGTTTNRLTPVQVSGLSGVIVVGAGFNHSLAVKSDGTVWAWGSNDRKQVRGDSLAASYLTPVQVPGLSGVIAVTGGFYHSLALKSDGTVWAWGNNGIAQLGNASATGVPAEVPGLSGVIAITAGYGHNLALKSDGTVWAWGYGNYGQLGDGTNMQRYAPAEVPGLSGVVDVAAGTNHSLALKSDGTVWAWGMNVAGQLGDSTLTDRWSPVQVQNLSGVVSIAATSSGYGSFAIKSDGTVWAWGRSLLGDGSSVLVDRPLAVQVLGLSGVEDIQCGYNWYMASKSDGTVWGWGQNSQGQLGNGTTTTQTVPARVLSQIFVFTDTIAPSLSVTQPSIFGNVVTSSATIDFAGTVSDAGGSGLASVKVMPMGGMMMQQICTVVGNNWSCPAVSLAQEGNNQFYVTASDNAGNSTMVPNITVSKDSIAPTLTISVPANGASMASSSMQIQGQYLDSANTMSGGVTVTGAVSLECNTSQVPPAPPYRFSFICWVQLSEGVNTLVVTGRDVAGNVGTASVTVTPDTMPPVVAISAPDNGFLTNQSSVAVAWTVDGVAQTTQRTESLV
ncbi:MAG: hypothetical protein WCT10_00655, partial [Patescibacteria group bacterium]